MRQNGCGFFQPLGKKSGYTLIEVVVSLLLVGLLSQLVLNAIMVGTVGVKASENQTLACAYGASLLEEMKAHPEHYIVFGEACYFHSSETNFLAANPEGVTAEVEVRPTPSFPEIYRVSISIRGESGGRLWEECLLGFIRIDPERI